MKLIHLAREKVKKHGWKAVLAILAYYIVRDVTLYVLIPYFLLNAK